MTLTLGNTSTPGFGFNQSSSYNQVCQDSNNLNSPAQMILVTKLWAHFGASSGTITGAKICIWGTGGSLVYSSPAMPAFSGGRQWRNVVPTSPLLLTPATHFFVGFWVPTTANVEWGIHSFGNWQGRQNVNPVGSMAGSTDPGSPFTQGETGGYIEYVPAGGLGLAASGGYSKYAMRRYNQGVTTWYWHPLKRWNAGTAAWEWLA